ncbi:biotin--[acetyl-CoA-carboxylase] ligase [Planctomycetota bacterium]|nr:biotin--[acetyl-CoA-carboxylase] ligase [Planctomycetota bacterium]
MHQTKPICVGLLDLLLNQEHAITIESLVISLRMSPERIQDELEVLRQYGCKFDIHPQHGIKLIESGLGVWSDYLESESSVLRDVLVYGETSSTQDICKDICSGKLNDLQKTDHLMVIAHHQHSGRGRLGRKWVSPAGKSITCSMIKTIGKQTDTEAVNRLTLAVSVAVAKTVEHFLNQNKTHTVQIKWPNDIWVNNKKIAGILVETIKGSTTDCAIIGVGLNVGLDQNDLTNHELDGPKYQPTSLQMCDCKMDRLPVLRKLIEELDQAIERAHDDDLLTDWRERCLQFKQRVRLQLGEQITEGEVVDIDPVLGLIVRNDRGMLVHMPAASTTVIA